MRARRPYAVVVAAGLVVGLVAGACGGGGAGSAVGPKRGGSLVLGAEHWPSCLNPITEGCGDAAWAQFTVFEHVLPRAMELDAHNNYVASPLLVRAPTLDNGLLTQDPFTLTYEINPHAVWDDGSPITSSDIAFTWRAILHTKGSFLRSPPGAPPTGYDLITSINTSNQLKAIITFKDLYLQWQDLFGGLAGFILSEAAFPNADPQNPDLSGNMLGSIPFSGGPWKLQAWSLHQALLIPNDRYWAGDRIPLLAQVAFFPVRPIELGPDTMEYGALRTGDVSAIYPIPGQQNLLTQLTGLHQHVAAGDAGFDEVLWFNVERPPMNDVHVRHALMYAIDRQKILDNTVKLNNPDAQVLNCGIAAVPNQGPWCSKPVFAGFTHDPAHSLRLLEADGWDCSNVPEKPCSKNGNPLVLEVARRAAVLRYQTTLTLLEQDARQAGIGLRFTQYGGIDAIPFFTALAHGRFDITQFSIGPILDPSVTGSFACDQIPTEANGFVWGNFDRWCNPEADRLMRESDNELDPQRRLTLLQQVYALEAKDAVALPLYSLPSLAAWRSDKVAGPVGAYVSNISYGVFFNMYDWYVP